MMMTSLQGEAAGKGASGLAGAEGAWSCRVSSHAVVWVRCWQDCSFKSAIVLRQGQPLPGALWGRAEGLLLCSLNGVVEGLRWYGTGHCLVAGRVGNRGALWEVRWRGSRGLLL